jgi:hypothetical protein
MTITSIPAIDPAFNRVSGVSAVGYAAARNTATEYNSPNLSAGQVLSVGTYYVNRGLLKFDTSIIPDTDLITSVVLQLTPFNDQSAADFDIKIAEYDWSALDPITNANKDTFYDAALAHAIFNPPALWRNTLGILVGTSYPSAPLTTTYINKTGVTYYALLSAQDIANTAPAAFESVSFYTPSSLTATAFKPTLIITHEAIPAIGINCDLMLLHPSVNSGLAYGFLLDHTKSAGPMISIQRNAALDAQGNYIDTTKYFFTLLIQDNARQPDGELSILTAAAQYAMLLNFFTQHTGIALVTPYGVFSNLFTIEHYATEAQLSDTNLITVQLSSDDQYYYPPNYDLYIQSFWVDELTYTGTRTWSNQYWRTS